MTGGFDVRFFLPSNMLAVGPTSSGKTSWLKKLVENHQIMFSEVPKYMILFYKEWQDAYEDMERKMNQDRDEIRFLKFDSIPTTIEEIKDILEMLPKKAPKLVVFDDYLDEVGSVLKHFLRSSLTTTTASPFSCVKIYLMPRTSCEHLTSTPNTWFYLITPEIKAPYLNCRSKCFRENLFY